jgi:osmoprotectant transport system substrate-binding protein
MPMRHPTRLTGPSAWLAALALTGAALSACGGGGDDAGGGGSGPLAGASFTVGSKEFTEQLILGQIAIKALENAGAKVTDKIGTQGTANTRKALTTGQTHMYWEYTGTGWNEHLGHEAADAPADTQQLYRQVADEDRQKNQIVWLKPAPMNNTYAIATAQGRGRQLGVRTLSDYARLANSNPRQASLCAANEFLTRDDGWPGVQKAYGFTLPEGSISEVDLGIVYTRVPKGEPCNFGEVFATDGRIVVNKLEIVQDDKQFFVNYNLAMTIRKDVYDKYQQQLAQVFDPITQKLTNETMQRLNTQVDDDGLPEEVVAESFLEDNGLLG